MVSAPRHDAKGAAWNMAATASSRKRTFSIYAAGAECSGADLQNDQRRNRMHAGVILMVAGSLAASSMDGITAWSWQKPRETDHGRPTEKYLRRDRRPVQGFTSSVDITKQSSRARCACGGSGRWTASPSRRWTGDLEAELDGPMKLPGAGKSPGPSVALSFDTTRASPGQCVDDQHEGRSRTGP